MTKHKEQQQYRGNVCAQEDFCKGCGNFDAFFNSCNLAAYDTSIQGSKTQIHPVTNHSRWLLAIVGCASDTRKRSECGAFTGPDPLELAKLSGREEEVFTTLSVVRNTKERYEDDESATVEDILDDIRNHLEGSLIDVQEKIAELRQRGREKNAEQ